MTEACPRCGTHRQLRVGGGAHERGEWCLAYHNRDLLLEAGYSPAGLAAHWENEFASLGSSPLSERLRVAIPAARLFPGVPSKFVRMPSVLEGRAIYLGCGDLAEYEAAALAAPKVPARASAHGPRLCWSLWMPRWSLLVYRSWVWWKAGNSALTSSSVPVPDAHVGRMLELLLESDAATQAAVSAALQLSSWEATCEAFLGYLPEDKRRW